MKRYVLGFLFANVRTRVLLIRKDHPNWMAGKLNGIGGKVELGETAKRAMIRECKEETGLNIQYWNHFADLCGKEDDTNSRDWIVHCFAGAAKDSRDFKIRPHDNEPVSWFITTDVVRGIHGPIMPNLSWLMYMAIANLDGIDRAISFRIYEDYKLHSTE